MGRDGNIACLDCRVNHYLGYGSHTTWLDEVLSLADFNASPERLQVFQKNRAVRLVLSKHDGHRLHQWSGDWCDVDGEDLVLSVTDERTVVIPGFAAFENIDLSDQRPG